MILIFLVAFSLCCWSWFWSSWLWYPSIILCFYFEAGCDPHIPHPFHDCDIHLIGHGPFTTCCDPHASSWPCCLFVASWHLHLPSPFLDCDFHLASHGPFSIGCDPHILGHVVYLLQVGIFIFLVKLSVCYKLWFSSYCSCYLFLTSRDLRLLLFLVTIFIFLLVILIIVMVLILIFFCS